MKRASKEKWDKVVLYMGDMTYAEFGSQNGIRVTLSANWVIIEYVLGLTTGNKVAFPSRLITRVVFGKRIK